MALWTSFPGVATYDIVGLVVSTDFELCQSNNVKSGTLRRARLVSGRASRDCHHKNSKFEIRNFGMGIRYSVIRSDVMKAEDRKVLRHLLTEVRVLSLGVVVEGEPCVGLLPFVVGSDFQSALVHASDLAKHSRGLQTGAPFSILIHGADVPDGDPLQVARVAISGTVEQVERTASAYPMLRKAYIGRFPTSERTFMLGDFFLYRLVFERGRLVAGFARAVNLRPDSFAELSSS